MQAATTGAGTAIRFDDLFDARQVLGQRSTIGSTRFGGALGGAIRFDDPDIGIDWGLPDGVEALLSDKDAKAPLLRDFETPFVYEG